MEPSQDQNSSRFSPSSFLLEPRWDPSQQSDSSKHKNNDSPQIPETGTDLLSSYTSTSTSSSSSTCSLSPKNINQPDYYVNNMNQHMNHHMNHDSPQLSESQFQKLQTFIEQKIPQLWKQDLESIMKTVVQDMESSKHSFQQLFDSIVDKRFSGFSQNIYNMVKNETQESTNVITKTISSESKKVTDTMTQVIQQESKKNVEELTNVIRLEFSTFHKTIEGKQIINEGVKLPINNYFQMIKYNPLLKKVLFIMHFVISTKDGVMMCWPFKMKTGEYVFVSNVYLLKFAIKHFFPKDIKQNEVDNLIPNLRDAQIETYLFDDEEMEHLRNFFPVEMCPPKKVDVDRQMNWFGFRAEILKELFGAISFVSALLSNSKYTALFKEWKKIGFETGKMQTEFPEWGLTPKSRSYIYPTKSKDTVVGKIKWGTPFLPEYFNEDTYEAIRRLGIQEISFEDEKTQEILKDKCHIGCGWVVLLNEPIRKRPIHRPTVSSAIPEEKKSRNKNTRKRSNVSEPPVEITQRKGTRSSTRGKKIQEPEEEEEKEPKEPNEERKEIGPELTNKSNEMEEDSTDIEERRKRIKAGVEDIFGCLDESSGSESDESAD
jgi:hypothetical protein